MDKLNIGIIGMGYVGLPLAVLFAESDYNVIGIDSNSTICSNINNGISHIKDIDSERLINLTKKNKISASTDFSLLKNCHVISICVPTPLNKIKDPDLSYVLSATKEISKYLTEGQLIILESTTYPGTTKELILPILEKTGLRAGKDFFLCFSPERVDPGNKQWNTKNTPKIIGGISEKCKNVGLEIYNKVFDKVIEVENTDAAELVKVYENTFRMINIALANELSQVCDKLGLNVWKIIDAASTKPFGFMKFTPGPGLGGHCIPLDPYYLSWKMRSLSFKTRMIDLASEINSEMPMYTVEKIGKILNNQKKSFKGSNILLIGIAYKKDIDDMRESPALEIFEILQKLGANVSYHDPYCTIITNEDHVNLEKLPIYSKQINKELLFESDITVILTNHSNIDFNFIIQNSKYLLDTRGVSINS